MDKNSIDKTLLEFPCDFMIKAFGFASEKFEIAVLSIVRKHAPDLREGAVKLTPSKDGKYLSISVTVHAMNKTQLDNIYQDLTACPDVIMAL